MSLPLFVYGTLREPTLLAILLGRRPAPPLPAVAPGWRAVPAPGKPWPILARAPGRAAEGLVLLGLTAFETDLLDAWEGDAYRRLPLAVMIGEELHEAEAYLPVVAPAGDAPDWSYGAWKEVHAAEAIAAARAEAEELRAHLISIRPN